MALFSKLQFLSKIEVFINSKSLKLLVYLYNMQKIRDNTVKVMAYHVEYHEGIP